MRSSLTRDILEHLVEGGELMLEAFFPPGYSFTEPSREFFGFTCRHRFIPTQKASISSILSRLREAGLTARDGARKTASWRITREGKSYLRSAGARKALLKNEYTLPQKDGKVRVVAFDIPEDQRRKRNWLRAQLLACDFTSLQKSVWIGTRPLPETLLTELDELDLAKHVHIMGIGEKGTLMM